MSPYLPCLYSYRAKNIRNRPELNQKISKTTMIKELAGEIEKLKMDLVATREKNGVFLSVESHEQVGGAFYNGSGVRDDAGEDPHTGSNIYGLVVSTNRSVHFVWVNQ